MADYHVDYINGSDSTGDGSTGNPWGTITHALTQGAAGTGDTVKVAGSGLTTVDSTATLSTQGGANIDVLTTTTDLTSSISVGDIVKVYPNGVTEYVDWPTMYVTAIDATSITFYENVYMPGDWNQAYNAGATGTYTIKTIDSIYGTTTTVEDLSSQLGAGADVIGGYDATFTSIIGLTYIRRSGMGGGAGTGTGWIFRTNNNNINQANFENFHFSQFSKAIDTEYGASYFGTNLHFYYNTSEATGSYGNVYNKAGGATNLYFSNTQGRIGIGAYQENFANAGYDFQQNIYQLIGNRYVEFSVGAAITKYVIWNPGMNSAGAAFGRTYNIRSNNNIFSDCEYITNVLEENRGGFAGVNQTVILFNNSSGNVDSLTLIDGNTSQDWYFALEDISGGSLGSNRNTMKLPATFDLTAASVLPHLAGGRDPNPGRGAVEACFIDTNGTWKTEQGSYQKVNTTDYDTGNSSREVILPSRMAYASADPRVYIAQVTKTTTAAPTSIVIRYKYTGAGFGTRIYFENMSMGEGAQLSTNNIQLTGDGTWRDATYTCGTGGTFDALWNLIAVGATWGIDFQALFYNQDPKVFLIDSVTVNY